MHLAVVTYGAVVDSLRTLAPDDGQVDRAPSTLPSEMLPNVLVRPSLLVAIAWPPLGDLPFTPVTDTWLPLDWLSTTTPLKPY